MSTFFTKQVLFFIACLVGLFSYSQSNFETLGESAFALNYKTSSDYGFNFSMRSRYYLYQEDHFTFNNRQIDLVHFSTFRLSYNQSLSLGVQYRFREQIDGGMNELRFTQQFNFTRQSLALRFGHRLRLEQRLFEDFTLIRSRYRFALDFPFNGEKLDLGEGYFVGTMEALLTLGSTTKPLADHRTTLQVGWLIAKGMKLQTGLEYRFENLNRRIEHKLFVLTSAIIFI